MLFKCPLSSYPAVLKRIILISFNLPLSAFQIAHYCPYKSCQDILLTPTVYQNQVTQRNGRQHNAVSHTQATKMSETYYYAAAMSIQGMEASAMPRRPSPEPKRNTHTQAAAMASQTTLVAPTSTQKLEDDDASIQKNRTCTKLCIICYAEAPHPPTVRHEYFLTICFHRRRAKTRELSEAHVETVG